ncbi:MAG: hydrogen gas-evolving membrane-bound hydrogenase subunit E [Spirochaetales bacterium]
MKKVAAGTVLILFTTIFLGSILHLANPFEETKQYFLDKGTEETGAVNLVTAIYLAYRAYDTLGETIVLIGSVTGVLVLVGKKT